MVSIRKFDKRIEKERKRLKWLSNEARSYLPEWLIGLMAMVAGARIGLAGGLSLSRFELQTIQEIAAEISNGIF